MKHTGMWGRRSNLLDTRAYCLICSRFWIPT